MKRRIILILAIAFVFTGTLTGCALQKNTAAVSQTQQQKIITYDGVDGKTTYDLLKEKYVVEADQQSFGVMVKSINGLVATDKEFWLYSVNDQQPSVAADKYQTKTGDKIKWEYKGM